jgi:hypothetical protein
MFGQITIYTLLDDRLEDFDRMTERSWAGRVAGPGACLHRAPCPAPMRRILYEVYRDRPAYEHMAQPYVARYVAERRSMVLARTRRAAYSGRSLAAALVLGHFRH